MNWPGSAGTVDRSFDALADAEDLRSVICAALDAEPVDERSLRRAVWMYVGAERACGVPPERVIAALSELVDTTRGIPASRRAELSGRVVFWCVEAHLGRLGGDAVGGDGDAERQPCSTDSLART